ncbi:hypothetical protein HanRHA438_Chr06g0272391 [Helianthus annuus]|nr:hypothetical protein HanIR_Chr06g0282911 [Helianthus annuus]KAJ0912269.1 hypothetical protein HanRHA438_Chr06g0272391 [Helianthus annuus]
MEPERESPRTAAAWRQNKKRRREGQIRESVVCGGGRAARCSDGGGGRWCLANHSNFSFTFVIRFQRRFNTTTLVTTRMMAPDSSNVTQPWMHVPTTSNFLEQNYWSWNDTDSVVQANLNKPFDDPQMKH